MALFRACLANSLPTDESSCQIFRSVLQWWLDRNDRGNAIYVSKTTYLPPESELEKFLACASNLQAKAVELSFDPVSKIAGTISNPRFHFISTRLWRAPDPRSEAHTSELQSLMRISYAVF